MAEDEADEFPLHNCVFTGNIKKFSSTLKIRKNLIDGKVITYLFINFYNLIELILYYRINMEIQLCTWQLC